MNIQFSKTAVESIKRLDKNIQSRIKKKLLWFIKQDNPLDFAEYLTNSQIGHYRFRVGDYRIIFDVGSDWITVNLIGHRRDIYK